MAGLKTVENENSVLDFLNSIDHANRRQDCFTLLDLMTKTTGSPAKMWGDSIVGFGNYHYKYESGREGDWFLTGFSPRKQNLTVYIMSGFSDYKELLNDLGKFKTSSSCLYIKKLEDIKLPVLQELIKRSVEETERRYS